MMLILVQHCEAILSLLGQQIPIYKAQGIPRKGRHHWKTSRDTASYCEPSCPTSVWSEAHSLLAGSFSPSGSSSTLLLKVPTLPGEYGLETPFTIWTRLSLCINVNNRNSSLQSTWELKHLLYGAFCGTSTSLGDAVGQRVSNALFPTQMVPHMWWVGSAYNISIKKSLQ